MLVETSPHIVVYQFDTGRASRGPQSIGLLILSIDHPCSSFFKLLNEILERKSKFLAKSFFSFWLELLS